MPRARLITLVLAVCACVPAAAHAAPTARLSAAFKPDRLNAASTLSFGFQIASGDGAPALLRGVDLYIPRGLGFATSGLGVDACPPLVLEEDGPAGCPPDSLMGSGRALVEIPIGPELVREEATVSLAAGPSPDGYLHILIAATGLQPVAARVVLSTVLQAGHLHIDVPPIASLPEAPGVAVVRLSATIGGQLTYYERVHGRMLAYRPAGITLPGSCPRGGFRFAARFQFAEGGGASGTTAVPCPRSATRRR